MIDSDTQSCILIKASFIETNFSKHEQFISKFYDYILVSSQTYEIIYFCIFVALENINSKNIISFYFYYFIIENYVKGQ